MRLIGNLYWNGEHAVRLISNLFRYRHERDIAKLTERLISGYRSATEQMHEATRKMDATLDYVKIEREEVLNRLHEMELEINALKKAVSRR